MEYRQIRGSAVTIQISVNRSIVDTAKISIWYQSKTNDNLIIDSIDMERKSFGVYEYDWQTTENLELGTYIIYAELTKDNKSSIEKSSLRLVE